MLVLLFELIVETTIIILLSTYLSQGRFFAHALICGLTFIFAILGALYRNEDKIEAFSGQRRYFMTLGHSTVWAFFIGIFLL